MQGRGRGVSHGRLAVGVCLLTWFACHSEESRVRATTARRPPAGRSPSVGAGPKALRRMARNLALR